MNDCWRWVFKIIFSLLTALIMFSRIWYGVHSVSQCIIGVLFGFFTFYSYLLVEDYLRKNLLFPLFYKERFRHKNVFAIMCVLLILSNYIFFVFWALVYTQYENIIDFKSSYENCHNKCFFD